jgi:hypothetical protein
MKTYKIDNAIGMKDPIKFLKSARSLITDKISEQAMEHNLKVNLVLIAEFIKPAMDDYLRQDMNFKTKNTIILPTTTNIEEIIKDKEKKILTEMGEFEAKGSGWTLNKTLNIELRINRFVPLRGTSYM